MNETFFWFLLIATILIILTFTKIIKNAATDSSEANRNYKYYSRHYVMTKAETALFLKLQQLYGADYYVFPQVRLSCLLNGQVRGQSWRGALAHINQKSVDFVLIHNDNFRIKCAIECDDDSHLLPERALRDSVVDSALSSAGIPIYHLKNPLKKSLSEIAKTIDI